MVFYIKSDTDVNIIDVLVWIDAYGDIPHLRIAAGTTKDILPTMLPDGTIDQQALANFKAFIDNIFAVLYEYYDIVDIDFSNKSDTSHYFWVYGKKSDGTIGTKVVCRLRISDHEYSEWHDEAAEKKYVNDRAQSDDIKRPKEKTTYQQWRIKSIVVDGNKYTDYDDAIDKIEEELEEYAKRISNK